jgi:hypothetical protein
MSKEFLEVLISIGLLGGMMYGMMKFMLRDIHKDLSDIRSVISDIRESQNRLAERMDKSDIRIDHLYHICIDLLKEKQR